MTEQWAAIAGYEGEYEVSSFGLVRSVDRRVRTYQGSRVARGRVLRITQSGKSPYLHANLRSCGAVNTFDVHSLVLSAFVGARPEGFEARHLDGDPLNNRLENLQWGTRIENAKDRDRHGTQVRGSTSPSSKLTESVIPEIRSSDDTHMNIAKQYGVSRRLIGAIKQGSIWKHVGGSMPLGK